MAETIIMLRGLARGKHHWGDFVNQVKRAFPDINVVAIDLAGNGNRFLETSPVTINDAVDDIRQQLLSMDLQPPYYVISLSLGGMITLQWLHNNAEIEKAIIMNPSHASSPTYQRMRPLAIITLLVSILFLPARLRERNVFALNANQTPNKHIIQHWVQLADTQPVNFRNLVNQIKLAKTFTTQLTIEKFRALLLASESDKLVNVVCSKTIAQNYNLNLISHPTAGHEISLDDPDWVIEQCKGLFNEPNI